MMTIRSRIRHFVWWLEDNSVLLMVASLVFIAISLAVMATTWPTGCP